MQAGLEMHAFNGIVNPFINILSGDSKLKSTGLKLFATGLFSSIGMSLCNWSEGSSKFLNAVAKTSLYSVIAEGLMFGINKAKDFVETQLEKYDLENKAELIGAGIEIGAGLLLRQAAGYAVNYLPNINNPFLQAKGPGTSLDSIKQPQPAQTNGFFSKICNIPSSVYSVGQTTQYNEGNFLSDILDSCGAFTFLGGVSNLGKAIYNIFTSSNEVHGLSVYDIRKILQATAGDFLTKEQIKEQSADIFQKMQMSDTVFSKLTEQQQTQVNAIQKLYDAAYGANIKVQYKTIMSAKFAEKIDTFIDMQTQMQVVERMMSKQMFIQQIKQFSQYYDISSILKAQSDITKQLVDKKLNNELQQLEKLSQSPITQEDKNTYKALFTESATWEIIYEGIIGYMQQQHDLPEFNA